MRIKAKDGALCAMFAALLTVGGFLRIPLPGVPLTLQSFFVFLAGLLLGKRRGAMACGVYLLVGLFGAPVFAQGGGIGYLLQPTFGYLLGFIPGTFLIGWLREGSDDPFRFKTMLVATLGGGTSGHRSLRNPLLSGNLSWISSPVHLFLAVALGLFSFFFTEGSFTDGSGCFGGPKNRKRDLCTKIKTREIIKKEEGSYCFLPLFDYSLMLTE